ncbi:hypothetical protein [Bacillus subtilis]
MIISLEEAQKLDEDILPEDLEAFEQSVRQLTNNNFQNTAVRFRSVSLEEPNIIRVNGPIRGLRKGDTVEINYSRYNDGLYTVEEILTDTIKVADAPFLAENNSDLMVTLVSYPADIKRGIKKLIQYDKKMAGKLGIKSETVSRMSVTYYDVNANENTDGYPASLLSFLKKYEKLRWG